MCKYICIHTYLNICKCIYVCIRMYVYVYINIHVYACLRTLQTATHIDLTATPPVCKSQRSDSPNKLVDAFFNS